MKVVMATGNKGKLAELRQLLQAYDIELVSQSELAIPEAEETGLTFIENSILKARNAAEISGLPALADDSGLAIDALGGEPGIYSARYAMKNKGQAFDSSYLKEDIDQNNIDLVLEKMLDVPKEKRSARFHCVLVYLVHADDPTPLVCHGQWQGSITQKQSGLGGFGYDPIFWVPECQSTAAELTKQQKNARSHRGNALKILLSQIDAISPFDS